MSGFHWNRRLARGNLNLTWIYSYIYTLMGILAGTIAEAEGKESCHFRSEIYSGIANGAVGFFSRTVPARFRWDMVENMAEKSREFRHGILLP